MSQCERRRATPAQLARVKVSSMYVAVRRDSRENASGEEWSPAAKAGLLKMLLASSNN